jgi:DNA invertase Pin-like site-specific DNA recombinase
MTTHDPIPARLAALKTTPTLELKRQWRELFDSEPPPFNRHYLESRLAYRIQELAYGGLKPETIRRLERLGEQLDGGDKTKRSIRADRDRPITGTRLVREWQGVEQVVTVTADGFEWQGRPYKSLSAIARAITGTRWNGWTFFGLKNHRRGGHDEAVVRKLRCAVYTRKSSEEGLEQEFNSLHAQREACEAYIASQRSEGWVLVRDQYDDGGISGGTLERPALKRLMADIEDGLIDVVVVYKIDRLSRSLMDFSKLVEVFDRNGVTFVSVTQSFNTTTSMGRLTLNILLSFAQFEREVTAERIRDKIRASRMKGMWMGGNPPLGYDVKDRKLVVNPARPSRCAGSSRASSRSARARCSCARSPRAGSPRSAASRSTSSISTGSCTTGSISARRCTRARPIPASTRRSSMPTHGRRCTRSCRSARASAPRAPAPRRRRC